MPRVHRVEKARKAKPQCGVAVGESYYWWKIKTGPARGVLRCSKSYPKSSELTFSEFWGDVRRLQEEIEASELPADESDFESLARDWSESAQEIADSCREKLEAMPEGLQQGPTGELLQERVDACEGWSSELESLQFPDREGYDEGEDGEQEWQDAIQEVLDEAAGLGPECG